VQPVSVKALKGMGQRTDPKVRHEFFYMEPNKQTAWTQSYCDRVGDKQPVFFLLDPSQQTIDTSDGSLFRRQRTQHGIELKTGCYLCT